MTLVTLARLVLRLHGQLVIILMARHTLLGLERWPFVDRIVHFLFQLRHVTFVTLQLAVLAFQFVLAVFFVIKTNVGRPFLDTVTGVAILFVPRCFKEVNVIFLVARGAGFDLAEPARFLLAHPFLGAFFDVALNTLDVSVLALEFESCFGVIKGLDIELHGIEHAAFVIGVTLTARFSVQSMVATLLLNERTNLLVAVETFRIGHALTTRMTRQAAGVLKLLVSLHEGARSQQLVQYPFAFLGQCRL